jgi:hypothetical protein
VGQQDLRQVAVIAPNNDLCPLWVKSGHSGRVIQRLLLRPDARASRSSGNPSGAIQTSRLLVRVLSLGGTNSGWSRLQVVTSISSLSSACWKVSWVPHREQNDRAPCSVELNRIGSPLTIRKSPGCTLNQVTNGAPVVRRQIEQWQLVA